MDVKARATLNYETVKALAHVVICKKKNPKKYMIFLSVFCLVLEAVIIAEMIFFGVSKDMLTVSGCVLMIFLFICCFYFVLPKTMYNTMSNMKDTVNEYSFQDDLIRVTTVGSEYNGSSEIGYSCVCKVFETSKHLFIYQTKNQVLVVDKQTVEGGSIEEVRAKLQSLLKKKYIVCNY